MKTYLRYLILLILQLTLTKYGSAQKILDPQFLPPDVRWDNFPLTGEGASQESISILIDHKGFIWSGTGTALYRFDGTRYIEYGIRRGNNSGFIGLTVSAIFEDSDGIIWIGTSEALNRLDQVTGAFQSFIPDPDDKTRNGNFVRAIRQSNDGLLWILTREDIYSFNRETKKFERFRVDTLSWFPPNSVPFVDEYCFAEDLSGSLWFVTYRKLYRLNVQKHFEEVLLDSVTSTRLKTNRIKCVYKGSKGEIWIGTEGNGLFRWDYNSGKAEKTDLGTHRKIDEGFNYISSILEDRDGSVWCFGNGTFLNYNKLTGAVRKYIVVYNHRTNYESPSSEVWFDKAFQTDDGMIWFLNKPAGLMFRFDPSSESLSLYRTPTFVVFQCIMDKTCSFWFTCVRNNIFRLVTSRFPFSTAYVSNTSDVAQTHKSNMLLDKKNQVWLMLNWGIYIYDNFDITSENRSKLFKLPDGDKTIAGGFEDSSGDIWLGSKTGRIIRYKPEKMTFDEFTPPYPPDKTEFATVPMIREDSFKNIWVATSKHGLFRFNRIKNRLEHVTDFIETLPDPNQMILLDFLTDRSGGFWLLTGEKLLFLKIPELKITDYTNSVPGVFTVGKSNIRAGTDSKGSIYILNNLSGLYQYDRVNDSFVKIVLGPVENNTSFSDLLIDKLDRIWVAHNGGITLFDPEKKTTRLFRTPMLQFDIQSMQTRKGEILFLNEYELYVFRENPQINDIVPPVYLTKFLVNGKEYVIQESSLTPGKQRNVKLSYRNNTLEFELASLNYLNPENNRFRYFMKGFDKDTVQCKPEETVEYKRMPPGNYTFWFTGANNDGLFNPAGESLNIRISPPWYRSGLAFIAYVLMFTSFIITFIRIRLATLRKQKTLLETEIKARTVELEEKNLRLAEMDKIKTQFFTNISHEIRTPLSLIIGPIENIPPEEITNSGVKGKLELVKRNAQRLMHLVNQLLDVSKLDAGKMKVTLVEDDIVKCIRLLVYEFSSFAESKNIKYIADLPEGTLITWFDRDKIEKIISNLLSNAFKYTPPGGLVKCMIRFEPGLKPGADQLLQIQVIDNGLGISKEYKDIVFDRFYRIDGRTEGEFQGTGIGLALVKEFVSLLKGKIVLESNPGAGSQFSVIIPLGRQHFAEGEFIIIKPVEFTSQYHKGVLENGILSYLDPVKESEKMRILLIEDNIDLRHFIRESLNDKYYVLEAENGRTGLNLTFTMMPDIIITDIMMPDIDGIEVCKRLKNDENTSHIPIIILTAKTSADDVLTGLKSGADEYLVKPFSMSELALRISNLLSLRDKIKLKYARFQILESGKATPVSVDDKFMSRVIKTISENINSQGFDVDLLGEQIGMSRSHFSRKIKILTGFSPGTLLRNIRLEKAAELLRLKKGNITEVSISVGMSNPSNFTKAFKNYFGVSPKQYSRGKESAG